MESGVLEPGDEAEAIMRRFDAVLCRSRIDSFQRCRVAGEVLAK